MLNQETEARTGILLRCQVLRCAIFVETAFSEKKYGNSPSGWQNTIKAVSHNKLPQVYLNYATKLCDDSPSSDQIIRCAIPRFTFRKARCADRQDASQSSINFVSCRILQQSVLNQETAAGGETPLRYEVIRRAILVYTLNRKLHLAGC
jgi:hypothetical protein